MKRSLILVFKLFGLITLACSFTLSAAASQTYTGIINRTSSNYFLTVSDPRDSYLLIPTSREVERSLMRMNAGDSITSSGTVDLVHHTLSIDSVDFVGLRRLLGLWATEDGVLVFHDFYNLTYKLLNGQTKEFRYSVSPSDGNEWVVFLSDDTRTIFATLEFDGTMNTTTSESHNHAVMKIFESETGRVLRTLTLERR